MYFLPQEYRNLGSKSITNFGRKELKDKFTATTTRTKVWVSGDTLTASDLNAEFNNLLNALALGDSDVSSLSATEISGTAVTLSGNQTITGQKTFNAGTFRPTDIVDSSGNQLLIFSSTASAVNEATLTNAATGQAPRIAATGDDTNIDLDLRGKGNGFSLLNILSQDDTTNTYRTGVAILCGWGNKASAAATTDSEAVTFGITFTTVLAVYVSSLGGKNGAAATGIGDFNQQAGNLKVSKLNVTTSGFTVFCQSVSLDGNTAVNINTVNDNWGYSWIAIGVK